MGLGRACERTSAIGARALLSVLTILFVRRETHSSPVRWEVRLYKVFPSNMWMGNLPGRCEDELLLHCECGGSTCVGYISNSVRRNDANWLRPADHGTGTGRATKIRTRY